MLTSFQFRKTLLLMQTAVRTLTRLCYKVLTSSLMALRDIVVYVHQSQEHKVPKLQDRMCHNNLEGFSSWLRFQHVSSLLKCDVQATTTLRKLLSCEIALPKFEKKG